MRTAVYKRPSREAGSALVEFALVVPLFFMIIFGMVALGIVFAGYCGAEYATRVAVRFAIVHGGDNTVSTVTSAQLTAMVAPYLWAAQRNGSTVTTTWSPDNNTGSTVTVSITLTYNIGIPFFGLNKINVGASSQGTVLY